MPECVLNPETQTRAHAHIEAPNKTPQGQSYQYTQTHPTPRIRPKNQGGGQTNELPNKARLRANIWITSQNVNGVAAPSENMNYKEKWRTISNTMHTEKIAILAIQETHLDQSMAENLGRIFEKNLKILNSANPDNPWASAGVGFVINKQLINPDKMEMHKLIPRRVAMLKIIWLKTCATTILNIYAPNERIQHPIFWARTLMERHSRGLPIPDFTLGDFNVTEDAINRISVSKSGPVRFLDPNWA